MIDLPIGQLVSNSSQVQWLTFLLTTSRAVNLPVTSWQAGGVARTQQVVFSYVLQSQDVAVSLIAQAGFLDYAATGSVSYVDTNGETVVVYVTPDPSNPEQNPDASPGWLDVLASSVYNETRIWATFAGGDECLLNTSASTYGPFEAGTYHVSNPITGAGYSNTASLTIAPSTQVGTAITGVADDGAGLIEVTTSAAHGRTTGDVVMITGVTGIPPLASPTAWEVTVTSSTTFTLDGSSFSGTYTGGGGAYLPTIAAFVADLVGSASGSFNGAGVLDVHTITESVTSLVGVSVDNAVTWAGTDTESNTALAARCRLKLQSLSPNGPPGAYEYFALSSQTFAPLLSPAQEVSQAITRALVQQDKATGYVSTIIANSSGAPGGADVTATNAVIQAYCVPLGVTAETYAATNKNVAAVLDLYVPAAYATSANAALFQLGVQAYFRALPIGGLSDPGGDYTNVVPLVDVIGVAYEVAAANGIPLDNALVTLNGVAANVSLAVATTSAEVARLSPATPTVNLIPV